MRVLALDVGSSSTRACLYDERGREAGSAVRKAYSARHDRDAVDSLDADELVDTCTAVLQEAGDVQSALAISCFWHSPVVLDSRDRPLTPLVVRPDRRAAAH